MKCADGLQLAAPLELPDTLVEVEAGPSTHSSADAELRSPVASTTSSPLNSKRASAVANSRGSAKSPRSRRSDESDLPAKSPRSRRSDEAETDPVGQEESPLRRFIKVI